MSGANVLVPVREATDVASARRIVAHLAGKANFSGDDAGALAIVVTEASTNLIKHGGGGDLIVRDISNGAGPLVEVIAIDNGPGMSSVPRCFEDGYSTAGSPGTGLGALARLSRFHDIYSIPGKGTVLLAQVGARAADSGGWLRIAAINVPYPGEEISGDAWAIHASPTRTRLILADGLGHGIFASEASTAAVRFVDDISSAGPADVIANAHLSLRPTRGAAIAVADIDASGAFLTFAGVGNVAGSVVSEPRTRRQMVSINGTLGHQVRSPRQFQYPLGPDALVILHSDGVSTHWSFEKYPGLFQRDPGVIAAVLFRDHRRTRDDATVVVARVTGALAAESPGAQV
jgi:anti-sigma regulatory factor (Ser/Thr protein kinase)